MAVVVGVLTETKPKRLASPSSEIAAKLKAAGVRC